MGCYWGGMLWYRGYVGALGFRVLLGSCTGMMDNQMEKNREPEMETEANTVQRQNWTRKWKILCKMSARPNPQTSNSQSFDP